MRSSRPYVRVLDSKGAMVIPKEYREDYEWAPGTRLLVYGTDLGLGTVLIVPATQPCALCYGKSKRMQPFEKGYLCSECLAKLQKADPAWEDAEGMPGM